MSFSGRVTELSEGVRCTSTASVEAKYTLENGIFKFQAMIIIATAA